MKVDFLRGYEAEKAIVSCEKISLKERSTVYVLNLVPAMACAAYQVDGYIIKGASSGLR